MRAQEHGGLELLTKPKTARTHKSLPYLQPSHEPSTR